MVRLGYLVTQSRPVAEEIAQEAFLTVLERWADLDNPGGYLRVTVIRAAVRSRDRHRHEQTIVSSLRARHAPEPGIDEMWEALAELPPMQRASIVLRFYCDFSHTQIAGVLDCSPASARMLLHRAITSLRKDVDRWTTK